MKLCLISEAIYDKAIASNSILKKEKIPLTEHQKDIIDHIVESWSKQLPDTDFSSTLLIGRILNLSSYMTRRENQILAPFGIDVGQFNVLAALKRAGEPYTLSIKEIGEMSIVSPSALTNRISQLEKLELLKRKMNAHDRRKIDVLLSQKGLDLVTEAIDLILEAEKEFIQALSKEEKDQVEQILKKLLLHI